MPDSIDAYFANLKNPKHLDDLKQLRSFLQKRLPDAEEDMRYGMPSYVNGEHVVVTMASQKNYMSLYMDMELVAARRDELGDLNCGKSCIRFKRLDELPLPVIGEILDETVEKQAKLE
jgi:uncharacterized protein YdhG (YjbR/CyaY superfamily)